MLMQSKSLILAFRGGMNSLVNVVDSPDDPRILLALCRILHKIDRPDGTAGMISRFSVAARAAGNVIRQDLEKYSPLIIELFAPAFVAADPTEMTRAAMRIDRLLAGWGQHWDGLPRLFLGGRALDKAIWAARRAVILDPSRVQDWQTIAQCHLRTPGIVPDETETVLTRAGMINPLSPTTHLAQASFGARTRHIDRPLAKKFVNALKRWVLTDRHLHRNSTIVVPLVRVAGDWRFMHKVGVWTSVTAAFHGLGAYRPQDKENLQTLDRDLATVEPRDLDVDFDARVFPNRVLLHPRLPDHGPWVIVGPAAFVERALRILRFANPAATLVTADEPRPDGARDLQLLPTGAPDAWLLPCLWGHWQIWWTVLPAILNDAGRPDPELIAQYTMRTRQYVTFWYAQGHERAYLAANADRGRAIADRLDDEASRREYLETMAADRASFLRRFFLEIAHRTQYFDYAVYRPGDVVLNVGVAEGFEIPAILSLISPGGVLHNVDPEGDSALGEPARAWIEGSNSTVIAHNIALSDSDGAIEMDTGGCWEDARISKRKIGARRTLPAKRLDTFIEENALDRIDHIKLDIEGGEGFLVDQLIAVMNSHRPQIEISIYHTVEQFIEIPERMMAETTGYRFFFRHYCGHFGEGTLYAIPREIEPLRPIKP